MDISHSRFVRSITILSILFCASDAFAQSSGNSNLLVISLVVVAAIVLLGIIIRVADSMMQIEGKSSGVEQKRITLFPSYDDLVGKRGANAGAGHDGQLHVFKKGFDIKLEGEALHEVKEASNVTRFAVQPKNFVGMSPIPKILVEVGDTVKAGQPIFFDKKRPEIMYAAPVSGELIDVKRAEKRSIADVVILADKEQQYVALKAPDIEEASREEIRDFLVANGGWPLIVQRPYNVVPQVDAVPKNIFISSFSTAPLAADLNLAVQGQEAAFQKGIDVLGKLTDGFVYLGLDGRKGKTPADAFKEATGVVKHWFSGAHPAGNVGIQIHHIDPISPVTKVWTVGVQEAITIGKMFSEGKYDVTRVVALAGDQLSSPAHVRTKLGANIGELLSGNLSDGDIRIISGDVLSGQSKSKNQFLNFHDDQVSVIEEGRYFEPFGWLVPTKPRPSISPTFPGFFFPDNPFNADTNTHGEKRAFVVTGEYEKVLPMDVLPQHLMKAVLANDYERMEGLGIHELAEEDIALCEFVCTSKMPLQKILRDGLEMMREQG